MLKKVYTSFTGVIADDLKATRLLFFMVSISFFVFGFFGANVPIKGPIPHRLLNFAPGIITLFFYIILWLSPKAIANRQLLVTVFLYLINFNSIYVVCAAEHMDMYVYQFIVTYVVSCYFFNSKKSLIQFAGIMTAGVILTAFTSHAKSTAPLDFYLTYAISQGVFFLLFRFRYAIEEKLSESEQKYRLLAENSFDLICVHSGNAKLEFISPSIERLLGYRPDELLGKYPISIVHPDDAHIMKGLNFLDPAHPFMATPVQFRLRHKTGEYIWFETIFTLMDEPNGTGVVLSQSRDIRVNKKYQLELEERSCELERSNADLETFAYVSSHDMQEPLRMISNYTQLLKKRYSSKLDKDADDYLNYANEGAINLQQLMRDLLSYSRIHRTEIQKRTVNVMA
ncbi:MAG: domain S-box, partial [Bacteroidota bacterium]|nr:domain S-box [Bacteroidota bacterium]